MIKFKTRYPFSIFLGLIMDLLAITIFTYHSIFGQLPIHFGLFYIALSIFLVDLVVCRYAGRIEITENTVNVEYFFPWREKIKIELQSIKKIETQDLPRKFYSKIFIVTDNDSIRQVNIQTWYGSIDGIGKFDEAINRILNARKKNKDRLYNATTNK